MRDVALGYRRLEGKVGLDNSLVIIKWLSQLQCWLKTEPAPSRRIPVCGERTSIRGAQ